MSPTARQIEILATYVAAGGCKQAAARLGLHERTVRNTLSDLHRILGAGNNVQAFAIAVQRGLIDPHELRIHEAA